MIQRLHALTPLGIDEDGDRYTHAVAFREIRPTDLVLCAECRNVLTAVPHPYREDVHLVEECRGVPLCKLRGCQVMHPGRHLTAMDAERWAAEAADRATRRGGAAA